MFTANFNFIWTNKIKGELAHVKVDIIENTLKSDEKYHEFVKSVKLMLPNLPQNITSYATYIELQPFKFVNSLIKMNKILEMKKYKLFQPIPLRSNIGNRYIPFDTSVLRDIFNETESSLTNDEIWKKYFNISNKKYKISGYSFNHKITTDGRTVVLSFIKNENIIKKENKNKNNINARNKAKKEYCGKSVSEIENIKKANLEKKLEDQRKKLEKYEQDKIKAEIKNIWKRCNICVRRLE